MCRSQNNIKIYPYNYVNYDFYQSEQGRNQHQNDIKPTSKQHQSNINPTSKQHQTNTNNNDNKDNNERM